MADFEVFSHGLADQIQPSGIDLLRLALGVLLSANLLVKFMNDAGKMPHRHPDSYVPFLRRGKKSKHFCLPFLGMFVFLRIFLGNSPMSFL